MVNGEDGSNLAADDESGRDDFIGSLDFYRQIAEPTNVLHVAIDTQFRVSWVSPSVRQIGGYEPDEVVGRSALDLIHPDDLPVALAAMQEAVTRKSDPASIVGRPNPIRLLAKKGPVWCEIGGDQFEDIDRGFIVRIHVNRTKELLDRFLERSVQRAALADTIGPLLELLEYEVPDSRVMLALGWNGETFAETVVNMNSTAAAPLPVDRLMEVLTTSGGGPEETRPGRPWVEALRTGGLIASEIEHLSPEVASVVRDAGGLGCWAAPIVLSERDAAACVVVWRAAAGPPWVGQDEYVERVARLAALALERHGYERQLVELAGRDPLTGLFNRRAFFEAIDRFEGTEAVLLFLDLDGFKPVNDRLGHDAGDAVLREVATRLTHAVRAGDITARLGGDEFAVLAPACPRTDAERLADRIVAAVSAPIASRAGEVTVGVSIGMAMTEAIGEDGTDVLLDAADAAMYRAKEAGGSRWIRA